MSNNNITSHQTNKEDGAKGALLITPVALSTLEDRACPICHEPYIEASAKQETQDTTQEWPVSVDLVAEWFGHKKCCGHVMGRRCLETHLTTPGEWSNKCPICRDIWFHRFVPRHAEERLERQTRSMPATVALAPRRSQRIAMRATEQRYATSSPGRIERPGHARRPSLKPKSYSLKGRRKISSRRLRTSSASWWKWWKSLIA